jgi:site-specific DNA-methyltransferase (adenine-specific)
MNIDLRLGDCIEVMRTLPDNSVDSVITDPPYGIGFMNKEWDDPKKHKELIERETKRAEQRFEEGKSPVKGGFSKGVQPGIPIGGVKEGRWFQEWCELWAAECYRVLKPGGYMLSFSAPRTYHRMATAFEEVGFQVRDQISWIFGSGFPKSHNIGKAIDKIQGNEREVVGEMRAGQTAMGQGSGWNKHENKTEIDITKGQSDYEGWGSALKPAHEPICMARKPLSEKSIAENVLKWGTGGINIDGSRIPFDMTDKNPATNPLYRQENEYKMPEPGQESNGAVNFTSSKNEISKEGRFPANLIIECICDDSYTKPAPASGHWSKTTTTGFGEFGNGSSTYEGVGEKESGNMVIHTNPECPCYMLDQQSGVKKSQKRSSKHNKDTEHTNTYTPKASDYREDNTYADKGGASRFFYSPKVSKKERNNGLIGKVEIFTPTIKLVYLLENNVWQKEDVKTKLVDTDKSLQKVIDASIIMEDNKWNIESFGNYIMEQFQKEHKSITETEINSTTIYQTLNLWIQNHTRTYIAELFGEKVKDIKFVENVEQKSTTLNITIQNKDGYSPSVKNVELIGLWNINIVPSKSSHPTVKPIALMKYLIKLVSPPNAVILEPFLGSGSTGIAAKELGFISTFIGIEKEQEYMDIAKQRIGE